MTIAVYAIICVDLGLCRRNEEIFCEYLQYAIEHQHPEGNSYLSLAVISSIGFCVLSNTPLGSLQAAAAALGSTSHGMNAGAMGMVVKSLESYRSKLCWILTCCFLYAFGGEDHPLTVNSWST